MSSAITQVPDEVLEAFENFCKENGWTTAEVNTLVMLQCLQTGSDLVVDVLKQRQLRQKHIKWFERLSYWPRPSELED